MLDTNTALMELLILWKGAYHSINGCNGRNKCMLVAQGKEVLTYDKNIHLHKYIDIHSFPNLF